MLEKITILEGNFIYQGKPFAPASSLVAYPGEQDGLGGPANVMKTPHAIDLVFAAGEKVVGSEVKLPADLVSSWFGKRLARQLRTLRAVVDVPVLVLRGGISPERIEEELSLLRRRLKPAQRRRTYDFWQDLVNMQTLGVYLLPVPYMDYLPWINDFRKALATNGLRAVAGTDQVERERAPGWLVRRIPGLGHKRVAGLLDAYGWENPKYPIAAVFQAAMDHRVAAAFGPAVEQKILQALVE